VCHGISRAMQYSRRRINAIRRDERLALLGLNCGRDLPIPMTQIKGSEVVRAMQSRYLGLNVWHRPRIRDSLLVYRPQVDGEAKLRRPRLWDKERGRAPGGAWIAVDHGSFLDLSYEPRQEQTLLRAVAAEPHAHWDRIRFECDHQRR
jgi:hypothetical protein